MSTIENNNHLSEVTRRMLTVGEITECVNLLHEIAQTWYDGIFTDRDRTLDRIGRLAWQAHRVFQEAGQVEYQEEESFFYRPGI